SGSMMNFERVSETVSSWMVGRATMSNCCSLLRGGSSTPAPLRSRDRRPAAGYSLELPAGGLDPTALPRPAPVVRHRRDVVDADDLEPGGGQRTDRCLPAGARALHEH